MCEQQGRVCLPPEKNKAGLLRYSGIGRMPSLRGPKVAHPTLLHAVVGRLPGPATGHWPPRARRGQALIRSGGVHRRAGGVDPPRATLNPARPGSARIDSAGLSSAEESAKLLRCNGRKRKIDGVGGGVWEKRWSGRSEERGKKYPAG